MALGSAGGLPTVPFAFTWYGGSDEPTAKAIRGRMRLCSPFLKRLYLLQSLGLDRSPWLLGFFLLFVFQFLSPAQTGSRIPMEIEERERDTHPCHGIRDIHAGRYKPKREKIHRRVKSGRTTIGGIYGQHQGKHNV